MDEDIVLHRDFQAFPSIRGFNNICKEIAISFPWPTRPTIQFRSKIKLHGTNAGVRIYNDGRVIAQKRTDDVTPDDDNAGFAAWVETMRDYFGFLALALPPNIYVVLHGEWAGPGVQKKAAVAGIPEKSFFVFSMETSQGHVVEPADIIAFMSDEGKLPERVHVIPWFEKLEVQIDFNDRDGTESVAATINDIVAEIDKVDPYIKEVFGVEGVGEGLVFYPRGDDYHKLRAHNGLSLLFKVKGTAHGEKGAGKAARVAAVPSNTAMEFAKTHVHEDRLEQGLKAVCGTELPTMKHIGPFLGWIGRDVEKETEDEREASDLDWRKDCAGPVALLARGWLFTKINAVTL